MSELAFVTFKWQPEPGYRSTFGPAAVNTLARMIARHYRAPHRFVCITDDAEGIDDEVEVFELWDEWARVPNPSNRRNPSCYRRLRMFASDVPDWLGPEFVCIDLDVVITGEITGLFSGLGNFKAWGDSNPKNRYNGSMWYHRAGTLPHVYEGFDPFRSPMTTRQLGYYGSDQAWLCHALGPNYPIWGIEDGCYSFRNHIMTSQRRTLPDGAKVVFFHGRVDPWSPEARNLAWVRDHYR